jgi:hypothetical protein
MRRLLLAGACALAMAVSFLGVTNLLRPDAGAGPSAPAVGTRPPAAVAAAPAPEPARADLVSELARAAADHEQRLRAAFVEIDAAGELSLDGKLERYQQAVRDAREQAPGALWLASPSMVAEAFFRMPSVQRELAGLGPGARRREIDHVRRTLGYDDAALAQMHEQDDRREERWQNGLAYMQERERVVATFEGEPLEQELDHLREQYFGATAPTIEREEADGFFRFERPRIYGRN